MGNPAQPDHVPQRRRPLRPLRPRVRGDRHLGRCRHPGERRSAARVGSPPRRSTITAPGRGVGDLRRVHRAVAVSRTSPRRRACPRTTGRRSARTTPLAERQRDRRRRWRAPKALSGSSASPSRESAGEAVKEFEVDGGDGCVAPSAETVIDGSYPLSRSLYIYVSRRRDRPARGAGVRRPVRQRRGSDRGGRAAAGYMPLPADRMEATRAGGLRRRGLGAASPCVTRDRAGGADVDVRDPQPPSDAGGTI